MVVRKNGQGRWIGFKSCAPRKVGRPAHFSLLPPVFESLNFFYNKTLIEKLVSEAFLRKRVQRFVKQNKILHPFSIFRYVSS